MLVIVVLVVSATISVVVIRTALGGLTHLEASQTYLEGRENLLMAQGCRDEALIQLSRDNDAASGTFPLGSASCAVTIATPQAGERSLDVTAQVGSYSHVFGTMTVTLDPFEIIGVN